MLLCRVGAYFCCQENQGPCGQEPPAHPRHIPSPVLWAIWTYLFLCYQDLPCHRRPLEAKHPATVAALLPIVRLLSA